jgi:uncharacterized protein
MAQAYFFFHAELNDFLPKARKQVEILHIFEQRASVKDTIESLGVPHPEVDYIEVNGEPVDFGYIVEDSDRIHVYPISAAPHSPKISVRPKPLTEFRFVLDIHLGKLANSLRLLGFDTLYRNDYDDEELARISSTEDRILLTRDFGLLMRGIVTYGYFVRNIQVQPQVVEVLRRFNLFELISPFERCLRCNGMLASVAKESILDQIPENVRDKIDDFQQCQSCGQVFWQGTHYDKMQQFVTDVLKSKTGK